MNRHLYISRYANRLPVYKSDAEIYIQTFVYWSLRRVTANWIGSCLAHRPIGAMESQNIKRVLADDMLPDGTKPYLEPRLTR